ncbi:MAG TPA: hypothetical protein PK286_12305 [Devosia sp.]|nr:hypothetical protein [Devosia sp.]
MTDPKTVFRRFVDAIVEGRARQAQRYVDAYRRDHAIEDKTRR